MDIDNLESILDRTHGVEHADTAEVRRRRILLTTAVLLTEVGEPPDVAEANRVAYDRQHELHLVVPSGALGGVRVQGLGGGQHDLHAPVVGERGELVARPPVTLTLDVSHAAAALAVDSYTNIHLGLWRVGVFVEDHRRLLR